MTPLDYEMFTRVAAIRAAGSLHTARNSEFRHIKEKAMSRYLLFRDLFTHPSERAFLAGEIKKYRRMFRKPSLRLVG